MQRVGAPRYYPLPSKHTYCTLKVKNIASKCQITAIKQTDCDWSHMGL